MIVVQVTTDNREPFRQYDRPEPWFGSAPEALLEGFAALSEVEVHVVTCAQQRMKVSPEKLARNIWFHSLHVPKLGWMRTGYQGCIRAIRRKVRELNPDMVHGQGTERECALAAAFSGFPNVITIHGNMRSVARVERARPFSFLWSAAMLERFTVPRTDGIVCVSTYTRAAVQNLARRTWLVPNAVASSFFSIRPSGQTPPRLLCIATICAYKNQNFLIRSLDLLARELSFELHFLGGVIDGDEYGREFLELLRTRPWCHHLGSLDRPGLQKCLAESHALVHPSLEDNCPMAILEAAAASVPIAAARVGGIPDLVEHDVSGLLFDPRDSLDIAQTIRRVLTEPALRDYLAKAARERAAATFWPGTVAGRHLEIYREVLGQS